MAFYHRNSERKRIPDDYGGQEELERLGSRSTSPKSTVEQEKWIRREIANSNERRRMQSINAGFQSLRALLPHREGEKLSKAAILQGAADYVYQLEQEKVRLLEQNSLLSRRGLYSPFSNSACSDLLLPKRIKLESADEGNRSSSPSGSENGSEEHKKEVSELRHTLQRERALRMLLEKQIRNLESRLFQIDSGPEQTQYSSGAEETIKSSIIKMGHRSPQSQISSQDLESIHNISPRESSPDLSSSEVPEDLSGKNNSVQVSFADNSSTLDIVTIPGLIPINPLDATSSSPSADIGITLKQDTDEVRSLARQNLETIFEAAKHVEGHDIFHGNNSTPAQSEFIAKHEEASFEQIANSFTDREFSLQRQIIQKAPLAQSRPGVIFSSVS